MPKYLNISDWEKSDPNGNFFIVAKTILRYWNCFWHEGTRKINQIIECDQCPLEKIKFEYETIQLDFVKPPTLEEIKIAQTNYQLNDKKSDEKQPWIEWHYQDSEIIDRTYITYYNCEEHEDETIPIQTIINCPKCQLKDVRFTYLPLSSLEAEPITKTQYIEEIISDYQEEREELKSEKSISKEELIQKIEHYKHNLKISKEEEIIDADDQKFITMLTEHIKFCENLLNKKLTIK